MEWLALLLVILSMGTFISIYVAPDEAETFGDVSPMEKYRQYRAAAGWALVAAKFTSPNPLKTQSYLSYVTTEFMTNPSSKTDCYTLSAVNIRLMLQMGFHRDPSKLPNISPFEGEMRRRMWHLAVQVELLVSFHLGLPSILNGLESDTEIPANLHDEDISPSLTVLPPSKPDLEFTQLSYMRWKSALCVIFGAIARASHSLTVPAYNEVMRLDGLLEERWKRVPFLLKPRPINESIADPAVQIHQRFGLASLYQKSRCVLHRRYVTDVSLKKEHAYSRRACLEAAIAMLEYQDVIQPATLPGGILRPHGWFLAAIATYDFLLAATIVYILYHSETYLGDDAYDHWVDQDGKLRSRLTKDELLMMLRRSHRHWVAVAQDTPIASKAADILETMLNKIDGTSGSLSPVAGGNGDQVRRGSSDPTWQQPQPQQRQTTMNSTGPKNVAARFSMSGVYFHFIHSPWQTTLLSSTVLFTPTPTNGRRVASVGEPWQSMHAPGQTISSNHQQPLVSQISGFTAHQPAGPSLNSHEGIRWSDIGIGLDAMERVSHREDVFSLGRYSSLISIAKRI